MVIVSFVVPAILHGHSPVLVAVTGAMAIMLVSLYLSHGTGPKTTAAVVGTALAVERYALQSVGRADDVVALFVEEGGDDAAVHAAGHGDHDPCILRTAFEIQTVSHARGHRLQSQARCAARGQG